MINAKLTHILDFHHCSRPQPKTSKFEIGLFANLVPYKDGYVGASRCGAIDFNDKINVINYDSKFKYIDNTEITKGEDPRCFLYKDIPHALTWSPKNISSVTYFTYKVINLITKEVVELNIDNVSNEEMHWQKLGKNWMPIVKDDILYFIITLEPDLNILKCNLDSGKCEWVTEYDTEKDNIPVTISRGGTPFLYNKKLESYIGIGHRTYDGNHHSPYLYTISKDFKNVYVGEDLKSKYNAINDPLSIFQDVDGEFYCCIAVLNQASRSSTSGFTSLYKIEFN